MSDLTKSEAWQALQSHYEDIKNVHMRDLFSQDLKRFEKFSLRFDEILLDFSKNRITEKTLELLLNLAKQARINDWTEKMFNGEKINFTEAGMRIRYSLLLMNNVISSLSHWTAWAAHPYFV